MLSGQIMVPSLREKWNAMREDARETLDYAFRNWLVFPEQAAEHATYWCRSRDLTIEFHHIRIGYAHFAFALIPGAPALIWDMELRDHLAVNRSRHTHSSP